MQPLLHLTVSLVILGFSAFSLPKIKKATFNLNEDYMESQRLHILVEDISYYTSIELSLVLIWWLSWYLKSSGLGLLTKLVGGVSLSEGMGLLRLYPLSV